MCKKTQYQRGDRGLSTQKDLIEKLAVDHEKFGGEWKLDDTKDVLLQESLSVLGETPHLLAMQNITKHTVFTYLKNLDGFGPFKYLHIPYDTETIEKCEYENPFSRINGAFYHYGSGKEKVSPTEGVLFGKAKYHTQYHLREIISNYTNIYSPHIGPSLNDKLEMMGNFKYGIACENLLADGYWTEKLVDCIMGDVVPIFIGGNLPKEMECFVIRPKTLNHQGFEEIWKLDKSAYLSKLHIMRHYRNSPQFEEQNSLSSWTKKLVNHLGHSSKVSD